MTEYGFLTRGGDIDPSKIPGLQLTQWRHGLWYTTPGARSTGAVNQNVLRFTPFWVPQGGANIDTVGISITGAGEVGSVIRLGFYLDDGTCFPGPLLVEFGTVVATSTGFASIAFAQGLPAGLLWSAAVNQLCPTTPPTVDSSSSTNPNVGSNTPTTLQTGVGYQQSGISGSLPANATPTAQNSGASPRVWVRAA